MRQAFSHVRYWVFDLDNTLYAPEVRLFDQIQVKMTDYVVKTLGVSAAQADHLRDHYWQTYGTTLAGLMAEHQLDPLPYLAAVHDIDFSGLTADPALGQAIAALPGRRIVFTNGSQSYAHQVLAARGLTGLFDAVYGVEHAGFLPKPQQAAFEAVFALDGHNPCEGAMFEDDPRNLAAPFALGMRTVLVGATPGPLPYIEYQTPDLAGFLSQLG
jgi:putative hydrolase of the HAD superfamily